MKYANQVNILLAVIGVVVVAYTFGITFFSASANVNLEIGSLAPDGTRSNEASPALLNDSTTRLGAVETQRTQSSQRSSATNPKPVWRGPVGTAAGAAAANRVGRVPTSNLPVWKGPTPPESMPGVGSQQQRTQPQQPAMNRTPTRPQRQPSRSPGTNPFQSSTADDGGPSSQVSRPGPPPGAESAKRGPDPDAPAPPVRSSMPETRPPQ